MKILLLLSLSFFLLSLSAQENQEGNHDSTLESGDLRIDYLTSLHFGDIPDYEKAKYKLWKYGDKNYDSMIFEYDSIFYNNQYKWKDNLKKIEQNQLNYKTNSIYLSFLAASFLNLGGKEAQLAFKLFLSNNEISNREEIIANSILEYYRTKKEYDKFYNKARELSKTSLSKSVVFLTKMSTDLIQITDNKNRFLTATGWLDQSLKIEKSITAFETMIFLQNKLENTKLKDYYEKEYELFKQEIEKERRKFALNEQTDTINISPYVGDSIVVGVGDVLYVSYTRHPSLGLSNVHELEENEFVKLSNTEYDSSDYNDGNGGDITHIKKYFTAIKKGEAFYIERIEYNHGDEEVKKCRIIVE